VHVPVFRTRQVFVNGSESCSFVLSGIVTSLTKAARLQSVASVAVGLGVQVGVDVDVAVLVGVADGRGVGDGSGVRVAV
jgi:hypothetical protein